MKTNPSIAMKPLVRLSAIISLLGPTMVGATPEVKTEEVWVVFKTHLDIGYTDRIDAVLAKYRGPMMDGALNVVEDSRALPPEKRFAWTLAGWPLAHVLGPQQDPARKLRIEQAVREGAIAFHALPFTTHTETLDLEDLVRGLGISSRLARNYGLPLPISGKMTDVPSHSWVMPTLLAHAGVKFLQIGCNSTSAVVQVPPLFWWEGPDGSRILCNYTANYGSGLKAPGGWPSKHYLAMEMTGDNHGPPVPADVERLRQQAAKDLPGVRVHFGTLDDFARAVLAENPDLPVVRADMPDTWIHGWLSMPQEAKAARNFRPLEPAVDALDTQLRAWGLQPAALAPALAAAYEQSELFSEHTFGPFGPNGGSWNSGTPRYLYGAEWKAAHDRGAYQKYEAAFDDKRGFARRANQIVHHELGERLELLAKSVNAEGKRVVVYNGLPWARSGMVENPDAPGQYIYARNVPANGYITYQAERFEKQSQAEMPGTNQLETPFYQVTFDLKRGGIASLVERRSGRELVNQASPYVLGQFLHECFDSQQMNAFHNAYGRPGYSWAKGNLPAGTTHAEVTPSAWKAAVAHSAIADIVTLTAADPLGLASSITLVFTMDRQQPSVEVEWRVANKTADPMPEGGWLCFPFEIAQPRFQLGRLGGPVDPAKDIIGGANRDYFCISSGLTVTGRDGAGMGLCPLDSSCVSLGKPGLWQFSLTEVPRQPSVFVNLYNNEWNTNFPEWQDGSWTSRVRVWPVAAGASIGDGLTVPAWEARLPLLATASDGVSGKLRPTQAGLTLSRQGVLVTAFGANPDGGGGERIQEEPTLIRVWEQAGISGDLTVTLPAGYSIATPVNLRGEEAGIPLPVKDRSFTFPLKAYAPASFLLSHPQSQQPPTPSHP